MHSPSPPQFLFLRVGGIEAKGSSTSGHRLTRNCIQYDPICVEKRGGI